MNDSKMINHLSELVETEIKLKSKEPYRLTHLEERAIDEAEADMLEGRLLDEVQAYENIKPWLS